MMHRYCLGSHHTAWCRRFAHWDITRQPDALAYTIYAVSNPHEAMYCKQHARIHAARMTQVLEDAWAWKEQAEVTP